MYTQYFTNVKQTNAGHKYMGNPTKHADTWKPHNMQTQGNPTTGRHMETPQQADKRKPHNRQTHGNPTRQTQGNPRKGQTKQQEREGGMGGGGGGGGLGVEKITCV